MPKQSVVAQGRRHPEATKPSQTNRIFVQPNGAGRPDDHSTQATAHNKKVIEWPRPESSASYSTTP